MLLLFSQIRLESSLTLGHGGQASRQTCLGSRPWACLCARMCAPWAGTARPGSRCRWLRWVAEQPGAPSWALWETRGSCHLGAPARLLCRSIPPEVLPLVPEPGEQFQGPVQGPHMGTREGGVRNFLEYLQVRSSIPVYPPSQNVFSGPRILSFVQQISTECLP